MIDTTNKFLVGMKGDRIVIGRLINPMTTDDALLLAAYLVAMAYPTLHTFEEVRAAVENT